MVYRMTGSGVRGSGAYIDPLHETAAFIAAAARRLPAGWGGLMFSAPLDLWLMTPAQAILVAIGGVAGAGTGPWFLGGSRAFPASRRRAPPPLAPGAAPSFLPTAAARVGGTARAAAGRR